MTRESQGSACVFGQDVDCLVGRMREGVVTALCASSFSPGEQNPNLEPAVQASRSLTLSRMPCPHGRRPIRAFFYIQFLGPVSMDDEGTEFAEALETHFKDLGSRVRSAWTVGTSEKPTYRCLCGGRMIVRHPVHRKLQSKVANRSCLRTRPSSSAPLAGWQLTSKQKFATASLHHNSVETAFRTGLRTAPC